MKLIQLPTQAFEQRLKQELEENPALETGKDTEGLDDTFDEFDNLFQIVGMERFVKLNDHRCGQQLLFVAQITNHVFKHRLFDFSIGIV